MQVQEYATGDEMETEVPASGDSPGSDTVSVIDEQSFPFETDIWKPYGKQSGNLPVRRCTPST